MEKTDNEALKQCNETDKQIYGKAKKRVSFKIHLTVYLLVMAFFWLLWFFLFKGKEDSTFFRFTLALTCGWFIFIVAHYLIAYKLNKSLIDKEIKRIKKHQTDLSTQNDEINENN